MADLPKPYYIEKIRVITEIYAIREGTPPVEQPDSSTPRTSDLLTRSKLERKKMYKPRKLRISRTEEVIEPARSLTEVEALLLQANYNLNKYDEDDEEEY